MSKLIDEYGDYLVAVVTGWGEEQKQINFKCKGKYAEFAATDFGGAYPTHAVAIKADRGLTMFPRDDIRQLIVTEWRPEFDMPAPVPTVDHAGTVQES